MSPDWKESPYFYVLLFKKFHKAMLYINLLQKAYSRVRKTSTSKKIPL